MCACVCYVPDKNSRLSRGSITLRADATQRLGEVLVDDHLVQRFVIPSEPVKLCWCGFSGSKIRLESVKTSGDKTVSVVGLTGAQLSASSSAKPLENLLTVDPAVFWQSNGTTPHWIQIIVPESCNAPNLEILTQAFGSYSPDEVALHVKTAGSPDSWTRVKSTKLPRIHQWVMLLSTQDTSLSERITAIKLEILSNHEGGCDSKVACLRLLQAHANEPSVVPTLSATSGQAKRRGSLEREEATRATLQRLEDEKKALEAQAQAEKRKVQEEIDAAKRALEAQAQAEKQKAQEEMDAARIQAEEVLAQEKAEAERKVHEAEERCVLVCSHILTNVCIIK